MRSVAPNMLLVLALVACGPKADTTPTTTTSSPPTDPVRPPAEPARPSPRAIETVALVPAPLPGDPLKTTIHRLSNGMTVYLSPDPQQPSVVAHVAVRAGSRHDPATSTGLAHYLEHMVFKGTTQLGTLDHAREKPHLDRIAQLYADLRKPGADRAKILKEIDAQTQESAKYAVPNELDQLYARIGITGLNAFTDDDATVYVAEVPKNRLAQWARVEAARYQDPVFRLFWPELEAVYEEKNRSLDNAAWRVQETFMRTMFPRHGYGTSSGIGEIEHLKSPAYADMVAFFERYYTPQNMAIILAGDVDASVIPTLEQAFGGFRRPAGAAVEPGEPAKLAGRTVVEVPVPSTPGVLLGWPLVAATHADRSALEVMDLLLLDGTSGILERDLLLPQKVASAGSNPTFKREAGWFQLYGDALAGQSHDEIEALLLGLVKKLQAGDFTDQDLQVAVLQYELRAQQQAESNQGRLSLMEEAFISGHDWKDLVRRIETMRAVTKADVMRVAKQYLGPDFLVLKKVKGTIAPPKIEKPGITPVKVDPTRQSTFAKAILDMPVQPIEPVALREGQDYERGTLPTGPVITVKNPRNGLFLAAHEYDFGRRDDKLACLALEVMKVAGAGKRTAEQLTRELHALGVSINTTCSRDSIGIYLSGLDRNFEPAMALLRDWLAEPAFDAATLQARVATALTERANAKESPQTIAGAAASFARYGQASELLVVPTNQELRAAKPEQLKKLLGKLLVLQHRTSYFGPRGGAEAAKVLPLGTGKVKGRGPVATKFRAPNTVLLADQDTAQTHVWLVWPRKPANDAERAVGALFAEYAPPLLYQEVREARGLAYTVFGAYDPGARKLDEASLFAYAGVQGDKTHDALDAVLETLRRPIDDSRLAVAKETIAQNHRVGRIEPRAIASVVYDWLDQGVTADPREERTKRTLAVTKAELEAWIKAALAQPAIVSITGARKKLDDAKLKRLGPITVVPKDRLFGF